jgi:hypothetical protein
MDRPGDRDEIYEPQGQQKLGARFYKIASE